MCLRGSYPLASGGRLGRPVQWLPSWFYVVGFDVWRCLFRAFLVVIKAEYLGVALEVVTGP